MGTEPTQRRFPHEHPRPRETQAFIQRCHPLGHDSGGDCLKRGGVLEPLTGTMAEIGLHRMRSIADADDAEGAERLRRRLGMDGKGDERARRGGRNRFANGSRPPFGRASAGGEIGHLGSNRLDVHQESIALVVRQFEHAETLVPAPVFGRHSVKPRPGSTV